MGEILKAAHNSGSKSGQRKNTRPRECTVWSALRYVETALSVNNPARKSSVLTLTDKTSENYEQD